MATFVISDTHFGHKNIIGYCDRPFDDVHHMNKMLTQWWNETVSDEDTVIFVGDFCMGNGSKVAGYLQFLNGRKICVKGNHDPSTEKLLEAGFDFVVESMVYNHKGSIYFFSHQPIEPEKARLEILDSIGARAHIHGHQHNATPLISGKRALNVSCENTNYRPMLMDELVTHVRN
jgi:calcineurin-like phosphoesterase family protein